MRTHVVSLPISSSSSSLLADGCLLRFALGFLLLVVLQLNTVTPRVHSSSGGLAHPRDINDDPNVNINNEYTRPIIGILSQEVSRLIQRKYPGRHFNSYIAASYVKFIEGAGGRVVPIWIGKSRDYYEDIMSKINGVLFPGGATFFNQSNGYADAGRHIYEIAIKMNERGVYMPIWGTCLGYELMMYLSANESDPRSYCRSSSQALPLQFQKGFRSSRLFGNASDDIINTFQYYPVTINFHMYCITKETFAQIKLNEMWNILSINHDWNGLEFISTVEHVRYPFYGVQFHPEKNLYEFVRNRNITHTSMAVQTSQYFADFIVNESRKNFQYFPNFTEETNSLIYNYNPEYTGKVGSAFVQQYLFEDRSEASKLIQHLGTIFWSLGAFVALQRFQI